MTRGFVLLQAAQMAGKWFIEKFLVHGLIAAISLPMTVLSVSSIIDAQWSVVSCLSPPSLMTARPSMTARSFSVRGELHFIMGGRLIHSLVSLGVQLQRCVNFKDVQWLKPAWKLCGAFTVSLRHTIYVKPNPES